MTTGEGGFITTNDDRLADFIRLYRSQGMRQRYHHEILGYNFRLTDIAAAIGLCQLDKLERNTERRRAIAARYDAAFADRIAWGSNYPASPGTMGEIVAVSKLHLRALSDADQSWIFAKTAQQLYPVLQD
jgi:perosamine synthetase